MRILHTVEFYAPSVGGAQEVVGQVSRRLVSRGHSVTVATTRLPGRERSDGSGVRIAEFDVRGNSVRGVHGETDRYRRFLVEGEFDVMLNYAAQQWATDLALPILSELPFARVLAPCGFSALFDPAYSHYFEELGRALDDYDAVALHSSSYRDAGFVLARQSDRVRIIPNGAGGEFDHPAPGRFRRRHRIGEDVPLILTVGSHNGMKGHALVLDALARLRAPRAVVAIVANPLPGYGCERECRSRARQLALRTMYRKRALVLDLPRHEVVEAFAAADVFVLASAVECSPLVLFESAASGTPFVTLPVGNAAEIADWTGGGCVIPGRTDASGLCQGDPDELAAAIDALIADPARRAELGRAGRAAWEARFRWETIVGLYESLYEEAIAAGSAVRA